MGETQIAKFFRLCGRTLSNTQQQQQQQQQHQQQGHLICFLFVFFISGTLAKQSNLELTFIYFGEKSEKRKTCFVKTYVCMYVCM
jgi:hypothetical protein